MSGNFPIGFPKSCVGCPSLVMTGMLGAWREYVDVRNEVMEHNADNPDRPAITSELLVEILESSTSQDDFETKINDSDILLEMSSKAIVGIDTIIGRIEDDILMHTSQCADGSKPGPVRVRLPRKTGGLTIGLCSAELNNPKLVSCSCDAPNCTHNNRISGIVLDKKHFR